MEKRTIVEVVLALGLVIFGGMALLADKAYYCDANKLAMNCDKLTQYYDLPNGKCWNSEYGNKLCRSGWERLDALVESQPPENTVKVIANGKNWLCSTNNGEVSSYTKCNSNENTEGYLGELV